MGRCSVEEVGEARSTDAGAPQPPGLPGGQTKGTAEGGAGGVLSSLAMRLGWRAGGAQVQGGRRAVAWYEE